MKNPLKALVRSLRGKLLTGVAIRKANIRRQGAAALEFRIVFLFDRKEFLHTSRFLGRGNVLAEGQEQGRLRDLLLTRRRQSSVPGNNIQNILVEPAIIQEEDFAQRMLEVAVQRQRRLGPIKLDKAKVDGLLAPIPLIVVVAALCNRRFSFS